MRTTHRRRRATNLLALFSALLVVVASAGCNHQQTAPEGTSEEIESLSASTSPASEKTPGAPSAEAEAPAPRNHIKLPARIEKRRAKSSAVIVLAAAD